MKFLNASEPCRVQDFPPTPYGEKNNEALGCLCHSTCHYRIGLSIWELSSQILLRFKTSIPWIYPHNIAKQSWRGQGVTRTVCDDFFQWCVPPVPVERQDGRSCWDFIELRQAAKHVNQRWTLFAVQQKKRNFFFIMLILIHFISLLKDCL